jgi:hypothetical protein
MNTITITIPKSKIKLLLQKLSEWGFARKVEVEEDDEPTKEEILAGIKEAVEEVKLIRAGKINAVPLADFLNEL